MGNDLTVQPEGMPREQWATKIDKYIDGAKAMVVDGFLKLGILLKEVRDQGYYGELGYTTFTEYLGSKDFSRASAYKCIAIHDIYVERFGVPAERLQRIGIERLYTIKEVIQSDGADVDEWLTNAEVLSAKDLKYEVKRVEANIPEEPETMSKIQEYMGPVMEEAASKVPRQYWSKIYFRTPAPGVLECIVRVSINDKENDD